MWIRVKGGEARGWGRRRMPRVPKRPAKTFGHHLQTREASGTATPALGRGLQLQGCGERRRGKGCLQPGAGALGSLTQGGSGEDT